MENFWFAFGLTVFAGLATGIGGLASVASRRTSATFLSVSLGFSAGVMLYVSLVEILPKAVESIGEEVGAGPAGWWAVAAFFGGMLVIGVIDRLVPSAINPHEPHSVLDPEASLDRRRLMRAGTMTAVAIAIHNFPEGVAVAVPIRQATGSRGKAVRWSFLSGLAEPIGALVGFLLLMPFLNGMTLGVTFGMVAGIMVFISLDELLPTAREYGEHHLAIYGLVAGMAVMAVSLLLFAAV